MEALGQQHAVDALTNALVSRAMIAPAHLRVTERQRGRERQRGGETERQRGREAERQRGREAERQRGGRGGREVTRRSC